LVIFPSLKEVPEDMAKGTQPVTRLCYSDVDKILVRGKNVATDLMGRMTFTEMMLFHLLNKQPSPMQVTIIDAVLICIMEHGLSPSAIAARQTFLGAPESLQGAVASGILGVGSHYAGTSGECASLLEGIVAAPPERRPAAAAEIAKRVRANRVALPGYGHPIHKKGDPRTPRLVQIARDAGAKGDYIDAMFLLGDAINAELGKTLVINASAAMGAVMAEAGLPSKIMRGIVLISRAAGLVGHLLEEMDEPSAEFAWRAVETAIPYEGAK
jgi:citrate synthase